MALHKRPSASNGKTTVTFSVPREAGAERVELFGEFNDWSGQSFPPTLTSVVSGSLTSSGGPLVQCALERRQR